MRKKLIVTAIICCLPLLFLVSSTKHNYSYFQDIDETIDNTDARIVLTAPNECEIGQLVELSAAESTAASFTWRVIPETPNFRVIEGGKRALFCSGTPGKYQFVVAVAKRDTVDCIVHEVMVLKPSLPPTPIDTFTITIQSWLPENPDPNIVEKLAKSFERVAAAGHTDVSVLIKTTALSNRGILGVDLEKYKTFLIAFSNYLKENYVDEPIEKHVELWFKVAAALRAL